MSTKILYVRIPTEIHERLTEMAIQEGRSLAGMATKILEVGLVNVHEYELKWVKKE